MDNTKGNEFEGLMLRLGAFALDSEMGRLVQEVRTMELAYFWTLSELGEARVPLRRTVKLSLLFTAFFAVWGALTSTGPFLLLGALCVAFSAIGYDALPYWKLKMQIPTQRKRWHSGYQVLRKLQETKLSNQDSRILDYYFKVQSGIQGGELTTSSKEDTLNIVKEWSPLAPTLMSTWKTTEVQ